MKLNPDFEVPDLAELPSKEVVDFFRTVNGHLYKYKQVQDFEALTMAVSAILSQEDFKAFISVDPTLQRELTPGDFMGLVQRYLLMLLLQRRRVEAALLCWGPLIFNPEPRSVRMIWDALDKNRTMNIIGGSAQGKTYSPSAWILLEWVLDPHQTAIDIVAPSAAHLHKVLFGDFQKLYNGSCVPLPGKADSEAISCDKKQGFGIFPTQISRGVNSKGELKGKHPGPRASPHVLFGNLTRRIVLIDEAQEVPGNVFTVLVNLTASLDNDDIDHVKVILCANPKDRESPFGQLCKPKEGWPNTEDGKETWISESGWRVVRLNAMLSENILQRKQVFVGFQTYHAVEIALQKCGGDDQHPEMWTFVYGMFPPKGSLATIIRAEWANQADGEWIFDTKPVNFGAFDVAYEGDLPTFANGRVGRAVAWRKADKVTPVVPRMALQVDNVVVIPRGDTVDMSDYVMGLCKELHIKAECFAIDRSGPGQGCYDLIRRQWNQKVRKLSIEHAEYADAADIMGISYAELPSKTKICEEDSEVPYDLYKRTADELWYAAGRFFELFVVGLGRAVDPKTIAELISRKGESRVGNQKRRTVEPKKAYKSRTGSPSPDRADAVTMLIQVARMSTPNFVPKSVDTVAEEVPQWPPDWMSEEENGLAFEGMKAPGKVFEIRGLDKN